MTQEAATSSALAPGSMVGAYRIEYRLGAGGVGTVYAAEEPTIKKRVAIKVLSHSFADDPAAQARFEREARAANDVRHPGIVDVFAIGKLSDGRPYLVMGLLEGRSLREEIARSGKMPPSEAWAIAREVADALATAHEAGIVHRDLKPDNVFLEMYPGRPARPVILDFGLAKVQAPDDEAQPMKLTQSGVPMGTPAYMAPEQWWGKGIDARTDQYAFGAMLFEMLASMPPFSSQQFMELAQAHLNKPPPKLRDVGAEVSVEIEEIVARALSKEGRDRFASMRDLIEAGDRAFGVSASASQARVVARPASTMAHAATALATPPIDLVARAEPAGLASTGSPVRKPLARFLSMHAAVVVVGLVAILAAGYAGVERHKPAEWWLMGGFSVPGSVAFFVVCAFVAAPLVAARRARHGRASIGLWFLALLPAVGGAFGTYTGWHVVGKHVDELPLTKKFPIVNLGMFEANAARFVGLWLSCILMLSIVAIAGISGALNASKTLVSALGMKRIEAAVAIAALAVVAAVSVVVGAPSAALVAGVAAGALAIGLFLPAVNPETAARDEVERALAGLLAVGLAATVGFSRLEAREAILWGAEPTRASRVAEIVAAAGERQATTAIALASIAVVLGIEGLRLYRLWPRAKSFRPGIGALALFGIVVAIIIGDQIQHSAFVRRRDDLRRELEPQFALFARLVPPSGDELDPTKFAALPAPALQVSKDRIAIDARPVARLSALEAQEQNVEKDLSAALARPQVELAADAPEPPPDLAVTIDRDVPFGTVVTLLSVARRAGAKRVDLLLSRGPTPSLPPSAPAEAGYALAADFVALRAEIGATGFATDAARKYGDVAPEIVRLALANPAERVELAVP